MQQTKSTQMNTGFTLIETLVGLFIFVLAFTALSQVSGGSLQDISLTKRKLTAQYLAEEGIEYVKYLQKQSIANATPSDPTGVTQFTNNVTTSCSSGCDIYFDFIDSQVAIGAAGPLHYFQNGLIANSAIPVTPVSTSEYERTITIDDTFFDPLNSAAIKVTSSVVYSNQPSVSPIVVSTIIHFPF